MSLPRITRDTITLLLWVVIGSYLLHLGVKTAYLFWFAKNDNVEVFERSIQSVTSDWKEIALYMLGAVGMSTRRKKEEDNLGNG